MAASSTVERDGAVIHYQVHGTGEPVLALAPGGMRSTAAIWSSMPIDPVALLAERHQVIVMDQRNAGASTAPVTGAETWSTYTADQLAVLDAVGVQRCAVIGMCIGGPFILGLLAAAPERISRAVVLQSIGLDGNRAAFHEMFDNWAGEVSADHPEAGPEQWSAYRAGMYDVPHTLFSVPESVLVEIGVPMLVLRGDDLYHPRSASELLAGQVPGARLVEDWKDEAHRAAAREAVAAFLK
jgi:pimeloyl-ACP methyl ester carboxylesterase